MRISDWSSDVCSSDLIENFRSRIAGNQELPLSSDIRAALQSVAPALADYIESAQNIVGLALTDSAAAEAALPAFSESFTALEDKIDRKSVVSGKEGSVRLDLGGPRILKKKKIQ